MKKSNSLISIIQPVFNGENYLAESIDSVLFQTYSNFEYIIVNDGSTDGTQQIINEYKILDSRIRDIQLPSNKGYIYALSIGISQAKGEYIFRIDSDDIIIKETLENRFNCISSDQRICAVSGCASHFVNSKDLNFDLILPHSPVVISWLINWGNPLTHSSTIFKKDLYEKMGGYQDVRNLEDWKLWSKFNQYGCIVLQHKKDVFYRNHVNQSTKLNLSDFSFSDKVVSIIKNNIEINFDIHYEKSSHVLWATYFDSNSKDLDYASALKAIKLIKQASLGFKRKNNLTLIEKKEFEFFLFYQMIKICRRLYSNFDRIKFSIMLISQLNLLVLFNKYSILIVVYLFEKHKVNRKNQ